MSSTVQSIRRDIATIFYVWIWAQIFCHIGEAYYLFCEILANNKGTSNIKHNDA